jgi:ADP-heptose:LPS heptosyltransferase
MHIATAVGTTTIGIFGPGEENIWFPYASPHLALRKNVPCHPCHLDFCNRQGEEFMECMKLLSVDEVFAEVKKTIGG